ncbi:MAG: glycosyltransferase family 2 protein [Planctomycetes bacterium]|nr:glycosyltransferase family 2 protein [Planctomycetota bacterium]
MPSVFTVVICTRNRAERLRAALSALTRCRPPAQVWEVMVVDNGSTDSTQEVVSEFAAVLPVSTVYEAQPGLSHARNRALREVDSRFVVFTDDDIQIPTTWLQAWDSALATCGAVGWFGGPVRPSFPDGEPRWLRAESLGVLDGLLVHHDLGADSRPYHALDALPVGANFGLRTSAVETVGLFRTDLGHSGSSLGLGEETDWLSRARAAGLDGHFVAEAGVVHPIDRTRLRWSYAWRFGVAAGSSIARRGGRISRPSYLRQASQLLRGLRQLAIGRADRFRQCLMNAGVEAGLRRERRAVRASSLRCE